MEAGTGRHLAKVTKFQNEWTAGSRRIGVIEEGDVFKVTWANLGTQVLGNRGGRREEGGWR